MRGLREFLEHGKWKELKKQDWLVVGLVGVLLLVIVFPTGEKKEKEQEMVTTEETAASEQTGEYYARHLEQRLERVLRQMQGVDDVTVMITTKDKGETVVEKDMSRQNTVTNETDSSGGSRSITESTAGSTTVYVEKNGETAPYVQKELQPAIEGVVVVAKGGGGTKVKTEITEAVQALFDVEAHRIKVVILGE